MHFHGKPYETPHCNIRDTYCLHLNFINTCKYPIPYFSIHIQMHVHIHPTISTASTEDLCPHHYKPSCVNACIFLSYLCILHICSKIIGLTESLYCWFASLQHMHFKGRENLHIQISVLLYALNKAHTLSHNRTTSTPPGYP